MRKCDMYLQIIFISLSLMLLPLTETAAAMSILANGAHGHEVLELQQQLRRTGYHITSIDGIFGKETKRAVLEFQRDQHMHITGTADRDTWRALKSAPSASETGSTIPDMNKAALYTQAFPQATVPESSPFLARSQADSIIATARKYIGVPYHFGGTTPKAFDCSGYLQYVFAQNGIKIPRTADEQYKLGRRTVSPTQLVPGDLVFFTTYESGASHCGIYLGSGNFIHVSSSHGVRIDTLSNSYWQPRYYGGKHIVE